MKGFELMNVLRQLEGEGELLCKIFPFFGGPWIGMIKAKEGCNGEVSFDSHGINGEIPGIKISEIQEALVLDVRSEEAMIFFELIKKESEAEKIRNEIRKNLGLPAFQ